MNKKELLNEAKERAKNYMRLKGALDVKEETLEEDLKFPLIIENGLDYLNLTTKIFNNGAKWQAERMYSEEDMKSFGEFCADYDYRCFGKHTQEEMLKVWFEQFKKK